MASSLLAPRLGIGLLLIGLTGCLAVSLMVGRYPVPPLTALEILFGHKPQWPPEMTTVLLKIRLPRILAALEVGAALAASGSAYQGMFRNPLVSPDILGVSAGAGFGAALAIWLSWNAFVVQASAFLFGLLAVGLTSLIGLWRGGRDDSTLVMILAGVIIGTMFSAFISLIKFSADPNNTLPAITFWLMGSLASVSMSDVTLAGVPILAGLSGLLLLRWRLNLLCFGDEEATSLGVNVPLVRLLVIVCATLATASAVAISGIIGLVGLVAPYLTRLLVGPDHRVMIPCTILLGSGYLLLVDDLARSLLPSEVPLGILTSLLGAPVFLILLVKAQRSWS